MWVEAETKVGTGGGGDGVERLAVEADEIEGGAGSAERLACGQWRPRPPEPGAWLQEEEEAREEEATRGRRRTATGFFAIFRNRPPSCFRLLALSKPCIAPCVEAKYLGLLGICTSSLVFLPIALTQAAPLVEFTVHNQHSQPTFSQTSTVSAFTP